VRRRSWRAQEHVHVQHVLLELERDGTRAVTNVTAARDARRCA